jgi:hypothetical protein
MRNAFLISLLFNTHILFAQNNTVSSGGQSSGSGGTLSYSIGQIAFSSLSGANGSLIQGVQQPYEISIVTSTFDLSDDLKAHIYPNPSADYVVLNIGNTDINNLQYVLVDYQGKFIKTDRIIKSATIINFSKLSNGIYFLRILSKQKQIKTYQIIKNK